MSFGKRERMLDQIKSELSNIPKEITKKTNEKRIKKKLIL